MLEIVLIGLFIAGQQLDGSRREVLLGGAARKICRRLMGGADAKKDYR
jgi:hypothetical protein